MKVVCERSPLLAALKRVSAASPQRPINPLFACILVEVLPGNTPQIRLVSSNTEIAMMAVVGATEVAKGEAMCVPIREMQTIVASAPNGADISMEFLPDVQRLLIRSGSASYRLNGFPADNFPVFAEVRWSSQITLPSPLLASLINHTAPAMSDDKYRKMLCGVYLHGGGAAGDDLVAVATNGHILLWAELSGVLAGTEWPGVIVPRVAIPALSALLSSAKGEDATIFVSDGAFRVSVRDGFLQTRLLDWTYIDYQRFIPPQNGDGVEVDGPTFRAAAARCSPFTEILSGIDRGRRTLRIEAVASEIIISSASDIGGATDCVPVISPTPIDPGWVVGANAKYIDTVLGSLGGGKIRLWVGGEGVPIRFEPLSPPVGAPEKLLGLVSPMRLPTSGR